jgi:hypothetical protein
MVTYSREERNSGMKSVRFIGLLLANTTVFKPGARICLPTAGKHSFKTRLCDFSRRIAPRPTPGVKA